MTYRETKNVAPIDRDLVVANLRRLEAEAAREANANNPLWLLVMVVAVLGALITVVKVMSTIP